MADPAEGGALYIIGLGGNRWHHRHGPPRHVLIAAMDALSAIGPVLCQSQIIDSAPVGPSRRRYANAAVMLASPLDPPQMLSACKAIEADFGRRRGQDWAARTLDLDLLLWRTAGPNDRTWGDGDVTLPHPLLTRRAFALGPVADIAPDWRDPISGLTIRQLWHRLRRARSA